jgi:hypothetical protein
MEKAFESCHTLCDCDALSILGYFSLDSDNLDPEVLRKTHPRSILAFITAVGFG